MLCPLTVMSGYPEKEFKFTGKWIKQCQGHYRAKRNKQVVWIPEYRANDGETILMVKYQETGDIKEFLKYRGE